MQVNLQKTFLPPPEAVAIALAAPLAHIMCLCSSLIGFDILDSKAQMNKKTPFV